MVRDETAKPQMKGRACHFSISCAMAMHSCHPLQGFHRKPLLFSRLRIHRFHLPYFASVLGDRTVRAELAGAGNVEDCAFRPSLGVAVSGLDPGLRLDAAQRARVEEALVRVGLEGLAARKPAQLSGGQRQRVALARSLVRDRPLLLLDEPFSGLDPGLRLEMLDLVRRLQGEHGLTVVLVTHNPQDALRIAGQAAFLSAGRVLAAGPTRALLESREPAELRAFLGPDAP